ncbi:protocadherin-11 X-linked-like [Sinocyclocheilus grahami]|uniref:protocadherin-11 X-linked-like n=1 Tax=Sinocyclocheilus grahami TaxID=75366 RepID=UPI0007AD5906|nr:PREDICTED: protocadherin-11 X-linked-like [Sinocyclocheilus grahami]
MCRAQEKDYTVKEEQRSSVRIGNLRKDLNLNLDPDIKLSSALQFKPVYKTGDVPLVKVEASTGEIFTTANRIDREKLCSGVFNEKRCFYEIEVAVLPDEIFRLVKIRFLVEDINDNAPLFQSTVINISIPENTAINSRYPVPSAFDPDIGINGIQHYELVKQTLQIFEESAAPTLSMDLASEAHVLVVLLTCLFLMCRAQEKDYTVKEEQPENVRIGNLRKDLNLNLDPDIKLSSALQFKPVYKTGDVPLVKVEASTGEIFTTANRIDREKLCSGVFNEKRCFYEIEVAVLPDEIFRLVKIRFLVEDINDNAPLFQSTVINISIPENTAINSRYPVPSAFDPDIGINGIQHYELVKVPSTTSPGSVVTRVFAIDNDTGMNAELQYSIIGGSPRGLFAIDKTTGNITLQEKIVAADQGLHRLVVKVKDLGQPESLHAIALVHLFVNDTVSNSTFIQEQLRKSLETPLERNIGDNDVTPQTNGYVIVVIAIIAGTMTVILVIFVTALVRCRQTPRHKVVQKSKQSGEWVSPNQEGRQIKKKKKKKKRSPKSLLLNFVTIEEAKNDDSTHEHINGTLDLPVELEEQTMGKYNWATTPTTFKPDSPDLAKHYKSASPQPAFQIKPETPVAPKKHHVIQELPLDNTFVVGCDSLSKCSSSSSDPYSVSECSCQGGYKHYKSASPQPAFQIKPETPVAPKKHHVIQELPLDNTFVVGCDSLSKCSSSSSDPYSVSECSCQGGYKVPGQIHTRQNQSQTPDKTFSVVLATCTHKQTQRRVTFHLPDGSQESCSDSGLGEQEPSSGTSTTQPLPLGFPQEEYYEQTSPNSRTEGDGNSDPESTIEVNLQKALAEASETCTQECLILGHSDSCWMPPPLTQFQTSGAATLSSFGFQQSWARGTKPDGRHTLGRSVPKVDLDKGSNRPQFYNTLERHCSKKEDPIKVIPLASFSATSSPQTSTSGGSSAFLHEHQL